MSYNLPGRSVFKLAGWLASISIAIHVLDGGLSSNAASSDWQPIAGGAYSWTNTANWAGGVPSAASATANLNGDISGAQTISFDRFVTLGALNLGDSGTIGSGSSIQLNAGMGGGLIFNKGSSVANLKIFGAAQNLITAPVTLGGNLQVNFVDVVNGQVELRGPINESGGSRNIKIVGGNVTLSGNNSFTGGVTVQSDGTLQVGANTALGTGTLTLGAGNTRSRIGAVANALVVLNNLVSLAGGGDVVLQGGDGSSLTFAEDVHFASNKKFLLDPHQAIFNFQKSLDDDGGDFEITFGTFGTGASSGQINLLGDNRFGGGVNLMGGIVGLGNDHALGTGPLTFNGGSFAGIGSPTIANLLNVKAAVSIVSGQITFTAPVALDEKNRTFNISEGAQANFTGNFSSSPSITVPVVKLGGGTLALNGSNTFSGGITVNSGTLKVDNTTGSATGSGGVTVKSGAKITGSGTVAGPLIAQGTVAPGNGVGRLSTGAETWYGGGHYEWEISGANGGSGLDPGWDLLNINGSLRILSTATSKFTIDLVSVAADGERGTLADFNPSLNYSWKIASTTTGIIGFDPSDFTIFTGGFSSPINGLFSLAVATGDHDLLLNYTAEPTPEPGVIAIGAAAIGGYLLRKRAAAFFEGTKVEENRKV